MLDALRHSDDPGLPARLLIASNAIHRVKPGGKLPSQPRCLAARVCLAEAAALGLISLLIYGLLVALQ